jgi:hypothetical protein
MVDVLTDVMGAGEEGLASYQETKTVMHHIGDDFSWPL